MNIDKLLPDPDTNGMSTLYPTGVRTPATYYDERTHGAARIVRMSQAPGMYPISDFRTMFLTVQETVPVTHLQTREEDGDWRTWMVDEPAHWLMLHAIARRIKGPNVCVAGLGLALILHILASRKDIERVTVVERNLDVCGLMMDNLPRRRAYRLNVWQGDFWDWTRAVMPNSYATFFIDLWRGPVTEQVHDVLSKDLVMRYLHPKTNHLFFCFQDAVDRARLLASGATHA